MLALTRAFACLGLFSLFAVSGVQAVAAFPHKILAIESTKDSEKDKKGPLQVELREVENCLKVSIGFAGTNTKKPIEPPLEQVGGSYEIFLDGMIVISESYQGTSLKVSHDVPLTTLQNGKHVLLCEFRSPSGESHKRQIDFAFDGSPVISLMDASLDKEGSLDASVTMHFIGDTDDILGTADVLVDERAVAIVPVHKQHVGKKVSLSELAGKPISAPIMGPGAHLLAVRVRGINGVEAVSYCSFTVQTTPELKTILTKSEIFQEVVATFLKVPQGYSGVVDVFCDQNIVLTRQSQETSISIKRAEVVEGLKKINRDPLDVPIPLVFSLRAANGAENWQKVDFK